MTAIQTVGQLRALIDGQPDTAPVTFGVTEQVTFAVDVSVPPIVVVAPPPPVVVDPPPPPPPPPATTGFLEPAGFVTQIDTGHITSLSAFSIFSPVAPTAQGEDLGDLVVSPTGGGARINYVPSLDGGYSPVRFGLSIKQPGTGKYNQRIDLRFSPGFVFPPNTGIKLCEPRTLAQGSGAGATENHVIATWNTVTDVPVTTLSEASVFLQGPNGQSLNLLPNAGTKAILSDGQPHLLDVLFMPESTPGAGDGTCTVAVDKVVVIHYTNVNWLAKGNTAGWNYLMFDPTYGGAPATFHPPAAQWWEFDNLYVSTL